MSLFDRRRIPEPEVMDDSIEVEAYASAASQEFLNRIDDTFVDHALRLLQEQKRGRALDIGCGPGRIALKLAGRLPLWKFIGVDPSERMIAQARANLATANGVAGRVDFHFADGNRLAFADASFDFVACNSVMHHVADPRSLLVEMARVARPSAAILLRDLRRPGRLSYPLHVRWHGRRYSGVMYKLYRDSVGAAYTAPELQSFLDSSSLRGARIFTHRSTHLGIERPFQAGL